ncbi:hypothetical protein D3C79_1020600 [compost metagenome]
MSIPRCTSSAWELTCNLLLSKVRQLDTVLALMHNCSAITRIGVPLASITKISISRWVMRRMRGSLALCCGVYASWVANACSM